ncbi:MAG: hypothetical protein AAGD13_16020 [Pseudomonadota bacterium]
MPEMIRAMICLILAVTIAAPAGATQPWSVRDLGRFYKDNHCLLAAKTTFRAIVGELGEGELRLSKWVAYANGVAGDHDAVITCTFGDNRGTRATLVVHSTRKPINGHLLARRIAGIFEVHRKRITDSWKHSFK